MGALGCLSKHGSAATAAEGSTHASAVVGPTLIMQPLCDCRAGLYDTISQATTVRACWACAGGVHCRLGCLYVTHALTEHTARTCWFLVAAALTPLTPLSSQDAEAAASKQRTAAARGLEQLRDALAAKAADVGRKIERANKRAGKMPELAQMLAPFLG